MIKYMPANQLSIEGFKTPFETSLRPDNRWVELSKIIPWDTFASAYISMMNADFGRPGISPRMVLGALIIKHIEKLDDRGVIQSIQENVYMQFFVGLKEFNPSPVFDPSLFVELRKRVGADTFDELNASLIKAASNKKDEKHNSKSNKKADVDAPPANKGKLQLDATVADQYITYPTDSKVLNSSRKQCEKLIDKLYWLNDKAGTKPRTYRRKLDTDFLNYSKKKNKPKAKHRKMNRKLLESVKRNLKQIDKLLDSVVKKHSDFPLTHKEQKLLWVIRVAYDQQKQMYDAKANSCADRIVNIFQPHVRPIVRGKAAAQVEFGSKLGVSLDNGFARIDTLSWNAYNESKDFILQVENYKVLHGYYPELVQVDKIYATRENRRWIKERGIRITAPPLGRKSKAQKNESYYQKNKRKAEARERNQIEGKFGQGKNGYRLNQIRATLQRTSESWIAAIFFIMNLIHYRKTYGVSHFSLLFTQKKCAIYALINNFSSFLNMNFSYNQKRKLTRVA